MLHSPRPTPAPAGDKPPHYILLFWPSTMGLQFGGVRRWGAGIEVDWRAHPGSESGDMLSYESQMPAAAGTRRSEKPELWSGKARWPGGFCHARPRPQRGTSPRTTFFFSGHRPWVYNSAGFAGGEPASRLIGGHIPDRSPGHVFIGIAHAGWRRHTKV